MIIRPAQPIATTTKSSTDRRAVFVSVSNESGIVDLLIPQRTERFGQLRCIYIDTSAQDSSGNGCTIETDLGQNVQAPAGTQGYYPVFIPFVSKLSISSNQAVNLLLLDFDVQPAQWHVANASSVVPNPLHVIVDDQPLATNATIQNWPASQHVILDGQPINVDSTVQNFPASFDAVQFGAWNVGVNNFPAAFGATQSGAWNVAVNNFPPVGNGLLVAQVNLSTTPQTIATANHTLQYMGFAFFAASIGSSFNIQFFDTSSTLIFDFAFPALSNYNGFIGYPINRFSALAITAQLTAALTGGGISNIVTRT